MKSVGICTKIRGVTSSKITLAAMAICAAGLARAAETFTWNSLDNGDTSFYDASNWLDGKVPPVSGYTVSGAYDTWQNASDKYSGGWIPDWIPVQSNVVHAVRLNENVKIGNIKFTLNTVAVPRFDIHLNGHTLQCQGISAYDRLTNIRICGENGKITDSWRGNFSIYRTSGTFEIFGPLTASRTTGSTPIDAANAAVRIYNQSGSAATGFFVMSNQVAVTGRNGIVMATANAPTRLGMTIQDHSSLQSTTAFTNEIRGLLKVLDYSWVESACTKIEGRATEQSGSYYHHDQGNIVLVDSAFTNRVGAWISGGAYGCFLTLTNSTFTAPGTVAADNAFSIGRTAYSSNATVRVAASSLLECGDIVLSDGGKCGLLEITSGGNVLASGDFLMPRGDSANIVQAYGNTLSIAGETSQLAVSGAFDLAKGRASTISLRVPRNGFRDGNGAKRAAITAATATASDIASVANGGVDSLVIVIDDWDETSGKVPLIAVGDASQSGLLDYLVANATVMKDDAATTKYALAVKDGILSLSKPTGLAIFVR